MRCDLILGMDSDLEDETMMFALAKDRKAVASNKWHSKKKLRNVMKHYNTGRLCARRRLSLYLRWRWPSRAWAKHKRHTVTRFLTRTWTLSIMAYRWRKLRNRQQSQESYKGEKETRHSCWLGLGLSTRKASRSQQEHHASESLRVP